MTDKLYYTDSHMAEFTATVIGCSRCEEGYCVTLERSAFFPDEAGQYADTGTLGEAKVTDVHLVGDELQHITDRPLEVGSSVLGRLDWADRFYKMQHHTAEHIVSGLVNRLYRLNNVGFHLGRGGMTVDFDGPLDRQQLDRVETLANQAVTSNAAVSACYPSAEQLAKLDYRSKKEILGDIRIVTVDGYDCCACSAPHVTGAAEIGLIKILDCVRYKGGVRLQVSCASAALEDYRRRYAATVHIAAALSAKQCEVADAFDTLCESYAARGREISALAGKLAEARLAAIEPTDGNMLIIEPELDSDSLRRLCDGAAGRCGGTVYGFCGREGSMSFCIASRSADCVAAARMLTAALGGKGGGRKTMAMGSVTSTALNIRNYFGQL